MIWIISIFVMRQKLAIFPTVLCLLHTTVYTVLINHLVGLGRAEMNLLFSQVEAGLLSIEEGSWQYIPFSAAWIVVLTILVRVSNGEPHKGSCQAVHCPSKQTEIKWQLNNTHCTVGKTLTSWLLKIHIFFGAKLNFHEFWSSKK